MARKLKKSKVSLMSVTIRPGFCDDSVCLKWFWNGLFCIFFRESPQIDSFFAGYRA